MTTPPTEGTITELSLGDEADAQALREARHSRARSLDSLVLTEVTDTLPCDIAVAPAIVFAAGCPLSLVLDAIRKHRCDQPPVHFPRAMLKRGLPPEVLSGLAERMLALANQQAGNPEIRAILLEGAMHIAERDQQLHEARTFLQALLEPCKGDVRSEANRWLNGLPTRSDARLQLGRHPLEERPIYGYRVNTQWVFDPYRSPCGQRSVNPYKAYALTAREIGAHRRANEQLLELLEMAEQAKVLPSGTDPQRAAEAAFLKGARILLSDAQNQRLETASLRETVQRIDFAISLLCEG
jgi:hypothetical protein